jgi:hypothetical protein
MHLKPFSPHFFADDDVHATTYVFNVPLPVIFAEQPCGGDGTGAGADAETGAGVGTFNTESTS